MSDPQEYMRILEKENQDLRIQVSNLEHDLATARFDLQMAEQEDNCKKHGDKFIVIEDHEIPLKKIGHIPPERNAKALNGLMSSLYICTHCYSVGLLQHLKASVWEDVCLCCGKNDTVVHTRGKWVVEKVVTKKVVKKKRWFTGKIYDDLVTEKTWVGRWVFANERT